MTTDSETGCSVTTSGVEKNCWNAVPRVAVTGTNDAPPAGAVLESFVGTLGSVYSPFVASEIRTSAVGSTKRFMLVYVPGAIENGQSSNGVNVAAARSYVTTQSTRSAPVESCCVAPAKLMRVSVTLILSGETYQFPLESPADGCPNAAAECGVVAPCRRWAVPGVPHFRGWHTRTYVSLSTRGFVPLGALPFALIFNLPGRFLFPRVLTRTVLSTKLPQFSPMRPGGGRLPGLMESRLTGATQGARPGWFTQSCTRKVQESLHAPSWSQLGSPSVQVTVEGAVNPPLPLASSTT